jgi:hypothetical protein
MRKSFGWRVAPRWNASDASAATVTLGTSGKQRYRDPLVTSPSDGHVAFWTDWNLIETK